MATGGGHWHWAWLTPSGSEAHGPAGRCGAIGGRRAVPSALHEGLGALTVQLLSLLPSFLFAISFSQLLSPSLCPLFFSHLAIISTSAKKSLPLSFCLFISLLNFLSF